MFNPKLTPEQRHQAADLRKRFAAAMEQVVVEAPPKLAPLSAKREELTAEIAAIERGAGDGNLEEAAQVLANRREQMRLVELQITELQNSRARAEELGKKEKAEEISSLWDEAHRLLCEIAQRFSGQHREWLERAIGQYVIEGGSAPASQIVSLIPWFSIYLKRIRALRENGADVAMLLEYLGAALQGKDFLMGESL